LKKRPRINQSSAVGIQQPSLIFFNNTVTPCTRVLRHPKQQLSAPAIEPLNSHSRITKAYWRGDGPLLNDRPVLIVFVRNGAWKLLIQRQYRQDLFAGLQDSRKSPQYPALPRTMGTDDEY
jgi:hypothetical protein